MSKIINISDKVYPVTELLSDVTKEIKNIKDIVVVLINKDGTSNLIHTGLSLAELALACKMVDFEFNTIYYENVEEVAP